MSDCKHELSNLDICEFCGRTAEQIYRGEIAGPIDRHNEVMWDLLKRYVLRGRT